MVVPAVLAAGQVLSDAQRDELTGPVKSVSTSGVSSRIPWQPPNGPSLVTPIWCRDCAYDPDGSKTVDGQVSGGIFRGAIVRLVRDGQGQVIERFLTDASTGKLMRHDFAGPLGTTERLTYVNGKLDFRQTYSYDEYGRMNGMDSFDGAGNFQTRMIVRREKDGSITERLVESKNGELSWRQTYDPETQMEVYNSFDKQGRVEVTWTVWKGKLVSFWEPQDSTGLPDENFNERTGENDIDNFACKSNGQCERSHVHYEYYDLAKNNTRSAEWRDSQGELRYAAYYKYETDSFDNWTYREVWVWSPELGEHTLLETDFRKIEYWQK
jgi:hypothetical protein